MDSIFVFSTALKFEKEIRDLYATAVSTIGDARAKSIFGALAKEEQDHVDFLEKSLDVLKNKGNISPEQLKTTLPDTEMIRKNIETMKSQIPEEILGDVKRVLSSALKLEIETTDFYRDAFARTEGVIQTVLGKFVEIEQRHTDVVRFELDYASRNGFWLDFMEKSMEVGW
jgi:rubrerythrin